MCVSASHDKYSFRCPHLPGEKEQTETQFKLLVAAFKLLHRLIEDFMNLKVLVKHFLKGTVQPNDNYTPNLRGTIKKSEGC